MTWKDQSAQSHYLTAVAIRDSLKAGAVQEATAGIEELIDALARSEKRALKSQLVRLMAHVLKWLGQPEQRSYSWVASIETARSEIRDIQEETPSLTDEVIKTLWDRAFAQSKKQAQGEINQKIEISALSWEEVFETEYAL